MMLDHWRRREEEPRKWIRLESADLPEEGDMREVPVGEGRVALARIDGRWYAFQARCPHASAALAEGDLRPTYVICPLHNYRFDLVSGRCLKPRDGPPLTRFPVEWREDALWIGLR